MWITKFAYTVYTMYIYLMKAKDKRGEPKLIHIKPNTKYHLGLLAAKKEKPLKIYIEELLDKHILKVVK